MSARTVGEGWANYLQNVIPPHAPAVQVEECKRAFYAGAAAMWGAVMDTAEHEDDEVSERRLQAIEAELADFLRLFKARERV